MPQKDIEQNKNPNLLSHNYVLLKNGFFPDNFPLVILPVFILFSTSFSLSLFPYLLLLRFSNSQSPFLFFYFFLLLLKLCCKEEKEGNVPATSFNKQGPEYSVIQPFEYHPSGMHSLSATKRVYTQAVKWGGHFRRQIIYAYNCQLG